MDDHLAVGRGHGIAGGEEEHQDLPHPQPAAPAVLVDVAPFDVLHHQVGLALRRGAAVEQPGDVGMGEARQQLALPGEEGERLRVGQAAQELDRRALLEVAVVALGQEDAPHPALPDLAGEAPDAQHVACGGGAGPPRSPAPRRWGRRARSEPVPTA